MNIGILGAATVGEALATEFIRIGHDVMISNRRGPGSLSLLIHRLGPKAKAVTLEQAAACPIVVLAIPWVSVKDALPKLPRWEGRILIDATNTFLNYVDFSVDQLGDASGSEIVAQLAPGAKVVKTFNTLPISSFFNPAPDGHQRVAFLAGDDPQAKASVAALLKALGLVPMDLGALGSGGRLMQLGGVFSGAQMLKANDR